MTVLLYNTYAERTANTRNCSLVLQSNLLKLKHRHLYISSVFRFNTQVRGENLKMEKMLKILRSNDHESKQRQVARLKNEIANLTEEVQLIEMTLDLPKPKTN
jgi:hypothetical protein